MKIVRMLGIMAWYIIGAPFIALYYIAITTILCIGNKQDSGKYDVIATVKDNFNVIITGMKLNMYWVKHGRKGLTEMLNLD